MEDFREEFTTFKTELMQGMKDEFRYARDLLQQDIRAAKVELRQEIKDSAHQVTTDLRKEIQAAKDEVIESVAQMIDDQIIPQIEDHDARLMKLEARVV